VKSEMVERQMLVKECCRTGFVVVKCQLKFAVAVEKKRNPKKNVMIYIQIYSDDSY